VQAPHAGLLEQPTTSFQFRGARSGILLLQTTNHWLTDVASRPRSSAHDGNSSRSDGHGTFHSGKAWCVGQIAKGDIQLVNNLACQHARSAFRDKPFQRRHIMRLWLRNEKLAWVTPKGLEETWVENYGDSDRRKLAKWSVHPGASRERVLFRGDTST
jgi:Taurine catabolism dioxygenase TauD, TfdA family